MDFVTILPTHFVPYVRCKGFVFFLLQMSWQSIFFLSLCLFKDFFLFQINYFLLLFVLLYRVSTEHTNWWVQLMAPPVYFFGCWNCSLLPNKFRGWTTFMPVQKNNYLALETLHIIATVYWFSTKTCRLWGSWTWSLICSSLASILLQGRHCTIVDFTRGNELGLWPLPPAYLLNSVPLSSPIQSCCIGHRPPL